MDVMDFIVWMWWILLYTKMYTKKCKFSYVIISQEKTMNQWPLYNPHKWTDICSSFHSFSANIGEILQVYT